MIRLPSRRPSPKGSFPRPLDRPLEDRPLEQRSADRSEVFWGLGWRSLKAGAVEMVESLNGALGGSFWSLCLVLWGESAQPRVRWWRDRQGKSGYEVYDPHSHQTHRFETMTQTRAWLESRYYR